MPPTTPNFTHECRPSRTCSCNIVTGLEPSEDCPVHGWGPCHPQCIVCGRFISHIRGHPNTTIVMPDPMGQPICARPITATVFH